MHLPHASSPKRKFLAALCLGGLLTSTSFTSAATVATITIAPDGETDLIDILEAATGTAGFGVYTAIGDRSTTGTISQQIAEKTFEACDDQTAVGFVTLDQQAGHADVHRLGYYAAGVDPIVESPVGVFDVPLVTFVIGGTDYPPQTSSAVISGVFGLLFQDELNIDPLTSSPNNYFPSELQFDPDGGDVDVHFAVFKDYEIIQGVPTLVPCSYIIAVEDTHDAADQDHNDFVFRVTNVDAVPEPSAMALIALGGVALLRRRRS